MNFQKISSIFFLQTALVFGNSYKIDFDVLDKTVLFSHKIEKNETSEGDVKCSLKNGIAFSFKNYEFSSLIQSKVSKKIDESRSASVRFPIQFFTQMYSLGLRLSGKYRTNVTAFKGEASHNIRGLYGKKPEYYVSDVTLTVGKRNESMQCVNFSKVECIGMTDSTRVLPKKPEFFEVSNMTYGLYKGFGAGLVLEYSGSMNASKDSKNFNVQFLPFTAGKPSEGESPFVFGVKTAAFKVVFQETIRFIAGGYPKYEQLDAEYNFKQKEEQHNLRQKIKMMRKQKPGKKDD